MLVVAMQCRRRRKDVKQSGSDKRGVVVVGKDMGMFMWESSSVRKNASSAVGCRHSVGSQLDHGKDL